MKIWRCIQNESVEKDSRLDGLHEATVPAYRLPVGRQGQAGKPE